MEFMASLQGGLDERKPSLFELLSEQQLSDLLPPSLRYLLAVATHRHPRYLLRLLNSFDEVYALLSLLVERHYLKTHFGGFTENFYGLKRERVLRVRGGDIPRAQLGAAAHVRESLALREADVWKNLAVMVGLPYLKRKLDEAYDIHAAPAATILQSAGGPGYARDRDALPHDATARQRILYFYKWFLRKIYPSVNAAYYFSLLAFNLAYLFDGSKFHSPFLWLVGTRMRRLGRADYQAIDQLANAAAPVVSGAGRPGSRSVFHPRTLVDTAYPRVLSSLRLLLPASIFMLKFLEWWHASDFARQLSRKAAEGLELPPPVIAAGGQTSPGPSRKSFSKSASSTGALCAPPPRSAISDLPIFTVPPPAVAASHTCPICTAPITTATASPYGHVYCYACIFKWVEGTHERQVAFMGGADAGNAAREAAIAAWREDEVVDAPAAGSRDGAWESGRGRCAVSGRRILGGTEGLRRLVV